MQFSQSTSSISTSPFSFDFPVHHTISGYCRITPRSTILYSDAPIRIKAEAWATAIDAHKLSTFAEFVPGLLQNYESLEFRRRKMLYRGGLDIPSLQFLGVNLDSRTGEDNFLLWARVTENWESRSKVLLKMLNRVNLERKSFISGALSVKGEKGDEVHLYIKYAKVFLNHRRDTINVISSDLADLVAVNEKGEVLDSQEPILNITPDFTFETISE